MVTRIGRHDGRTATIVGNGVVVGPNRVLTATHCVSRIDARTLEVRADGHHGRIERTADDLSLLVVTGLQEHPALLAHIQNLEDGPSAGAALLHRWIDPRTKSKSEARVSLKDCAVIDRGFSAGMSGSGLYDRAGYLVAIAQRLDGSISGPLDVSVFVEESQ